MTVADIRPIHADVDCGIERRVIGERGKKKTKCFFFLFFLNKQFVDGRRKKKE